VFTDEEIAAACRYLLRREEEALRRREGERGRIIAQVRAALAEVAPRFPVDRVWLYGSVVTGWWDEESDVDLAVEGTLSFEDVLKLWCDLDRRVEREVDVRLLAELPFAEKVRARGIVVYDRAPASGVEPGLAGRNVG
jgi:predicted nucleotidyltransferase